MKTYFVSNTLNAYVKIGKAFNIQKRLTNFKGQLNFIK